MTESMGYSLLPGATNANNVGSLGANGSKDVSLLDFNLQSTRKTVEILQAEVQLLVMRVDRLEKQNNILLSLIQQQQGPLGGPRGPTTGSASSPFLSPNQPMPPGQQPFYFLGGSPGGMGVGELSNSHGANASTNSHPGDNASPQPGSKQLEDDLQRLGLAPAGSVTTPSQNHISVGASNNIFTPTTATNGAYAMQQQQLAAAMAQHQREEAIIQMLQGQGSPTVTSPTGVFGGPFPAGAMGDHSTPDPMSIAVPGAGGAGGMGFLYPSGTGNTAGHMVPSPMAPGLHGAGGAMYGGGHPNGGGVFTGVAAGGNLAGAAPNAANNLSTSVTLDPSKSNNNESLDRACQQPWLKELILKNCKSISNFFPLSKLRNLWKLNLQGCSSHVDDSTVKLISSYNKRLSRLNLCGCEKITNATPLQNLSFLFDLNLSGCNIGDDSLEAVAAGCQQLSRLAINSCPLVTDISPLKRLKELKLLYCRYSGHIAPASIVEVLHEIGAGLLTLNVDGVKFAQLPTLYATDQAVAAPSSASSASSASLPPVMALKNLNMKDNTELLSLAWLTSEPGADKHFPNLEMLDVEGCVHLAELGNLASFRSLKFLRLSKTNVSQETVDSIIAACPSLTTVYLEGCANVKSVESLAQLPQLAKLVIDPAFGAAAVAASNGVATLQQKGHVELVLASHSNNGNNNGGNGQSSRFAGGATSPSGSPTSNFVPSMPSGAEKK